MRLVRGLFVSSLVLGILLVGAWPRESRAQAPVGRSEAPLGRADAPSGQMTWAVQISLAPTWFDPAETSAIITPFMVLYALHDAVLKPLPGQRMAPSLAESWSM